MKNIPAIILIGTHLTNLIVSVRQSLRNKKCPASNPSGCQRGIALLSGDTLPIQMQQSLRSLPQ